MLMATWQLQEAKQKLSMVVDRALSDGPQVITRHGVETAVLMSFEKFRALTRDAPKSLKDALLENAGDGLITDKFLELLPERGNWRWRDAPDLNE
jgi:prevent-host-death family protein